MQDSNWAQWKHKLTIPRVKSIRQMSFWLIPSSSHQKMESYTWVKLIKSNHGCDRNWVGPALSRYDSNPGSCHYLLCEFGLCAKTAKGQSVRLTLDKVGNHGTTIIGKLESIDNSATETERGNVFRVTARASISEKRSPKSTLRSRRSCDKRYWPKDLLQLL